MKRPGKNRPRLTGRHWLIAGLLAALLVCVLPWAIPKARHAYRGWSEGRERARQGRAAALAQISRNHLGIDIGSEEPWRLTFQRLLSERHGLWFWPPPNPRDHQGPWVQDEWSDAYQEVMDAAVARRFAPGELEAVAEEARAIYQKYLAEHPGEHGAAVELGPVPSLGDPALANPEAGRRFLKLLETRAGFPVLNEPGRNRVTRYVSSGSRGHAIRIHGIPDLPRQMEIVDEAQEILNGSDAGMIYLEFVDEEFPIRSYGEPGFHKGSIRLNRILTKEDTDAAVSPPGPAGDRPWIVPEPPTGKASAEDAAAGSRFLEALSKRAGFGKRYISSGPLGHTVTIYGIVSPRAQLEMVSIVQQIVNEGDFKPIYLEFRKKKVIDEKVLHSRILTKEEPVAAGGERLAAKPRLGMLYSDYREEGNGMLQEFEKRASYPDCQMLLGHLAHSLEIYGVLDPARQAELFDIVQQIINHQEIKPVHVEFRDRRYHETTLERRIHRPREKVLRSRILTKRKPMEIGDATVSGEIVPKPTPWLMSPESDEAGHIFRKQLSDRIRHSDFEVSSDVRGHRLTFATVPDEGSQLEILRIAQDIVNKGDFGRVYFYIEFIDRTRPVSVVEDGEVRRFPRTLRSRILTKSGQEPEPPEPPEPPELTELPEIVAKPPVGRRTEESLRASLRFLGMFQSVVKGREIDVSGGKSGLTVIIRGVPDLPTQFEYLRLAQEIVDQGGFDRVYVEFAGDDLIDTVVDGKAERRPEILHSRILTPSLRAAASATIFPEKVIRSWGYQTTAHGPMPQDTWESGHFGKATVRHQAIKEVYGLKEGVNVFHYRFLIAEETYATEEEAAGRIAKIRDTPPGVDTKKEPHRVLCDGIAVGKIAYIVSTDSVKFQMEALPEVMKLLKAEVTKERAGGINSGDE